MSALLSLKEADFNTLKDLLDLTDGLLVYRCWRPACRSDMAQFHLIPGWWEIP